MDCRTFSAALELSQKPGSNVVACSLSISFLRASMSKVPPQGSCSIPHVLYLFFGHATKVCILMFSGLSFYPHASRCHHLHQYAAQVTPIRASGIAKHCNEHAPGHQSRVERSRQDE